MRALVALTIAGSDSGGGAGIEADIKTFAAHDIWATVAITAVTAQNTVGVQAAEPVAPELVRQQIASVVRDIGVAACKTGMLATAETVAVVAAAIDDLGLRRLVVDPVMVSTSGSRLLDDDARDVMRDVLLPLATVLTPNMAEADALTGVAVRDRGSMVEAARALVAMGASLVMVTGGHLDDTDAAADCLLARDALEPVWLEGHRIQTRNTHGSGCVLSAAITAELARGMDPIDACVAAKHFVERAIAAAVDLGAGPGPVNPNWRRAD